MTKILIDEATVKLAMKAFKECHYYMLDAGLPNQSLLNQAFTAHKSLAEALAEQPAPVQEPEWYHFVRRGEDFFVPYEGQAPANATRLYTTPQAQPAREWVGLTEADMKTPDMGKYVYLSEDWIDGCKTGMENAAAKLKEKNT